MLSIFFHMSLGSLYVLLGKVSVQIICPFFELDFLSSWSGLLWVLYMFWRSNSVWCIIGKYVFPYSWFSFHFIAVFFSCAEHAFTCLWALYTSSLERCLFRSFSHFLIGLVFFPGVESCEFFLYFGYKTLVWGIIAKYIFPYSSVPFHFADVFFNHAEALKFDMVSFVYSFLYIPCSRGPIGENIASWNIWNFADHVP